MFFLIDIIVLAFVVVDACLRVLNKDILWDLIFRDLYLLKKACLCFLIHELYNFVFIYLFMFLSFFILCFLFWGGLFGNLVYYDEFLTY